ncbi:hypothetical protein NMY22_g16454 [Coprinellus aureogranulatus]|nr:hypothetical protein NMY22_g16454 [Coprinellus aureogranulatus]
MPSSWFSLPAYPLSKYFEDTTRSNNEMYVKNRAQQRPIPKPKAKQLQLFRYQPAEERRFISDCGIYVAQACSEGALPREGAASGNWSPRLRDSYEDALCLDLGWAALASTLVHPTLHWRSLFQLNNEDWENELVPLCESVRKTRREAFRTTPVKASKPHQRAGSSIETAIDVDELDDDDVEGYLEGLDEEVEVEKALTRGGYRIAPGNHS